MEIFGTVYERIIGKIDRSCWNEEINLFIKERTISTLLVTGNAYGLLALNLKKSCDS